MISNKAGTTEAAILQRILDPDKPLLSTQVAEAFLAFELTVEDKNRLRELAERSQQGLLSDSEREEIDSYTRIGCFLSIMQSKARRTLKLPAPGSLRQSRI